MALRLTVRSAEGRPLAEELRFDFEQARITLGRGAGADVRLPHTSVSDQHAAIRLESEGYVVVDGDSTNGTRVNGEKLVPGRKKRLSDGDRLDIGVYAIVFEGSRLTTETVTAERTAELARRLFRASQRGAQLGAPRIVILDGPQVGKSVEIGEPPARLRIGRAETCQLVLADPDVSREHAELVRDLDGVTLKNLESKNGVVLQGQVVQHRRLRDGDELMLGKTRLLFEEPADQPLIALMAEPDRPMPTPSTPPSELPTATVEASTIDPASARTSRAARAETGDKRNLDTDLLIYALAAVVIAVSVAGIVFLMRAG